MTIPDAVAALLAALVAAHPDKLKLDLVTPWDIKVVDDCGEMSVRIVVPGLRLK